MSAFMNEASLLVDSALAFMNENVVVVCFTTNLGFVNLAAILFLMLLMPF